MKERPLQPLLHDLVSVVLAPTSALSDLAGQISPAGVQGVFHADARVLSQAELRVDGREPESLTWSLDGPHTARFVSLARWLGDPLPDPTVRLDRVRRLGPRGLTEEIEVSSTATVPIRATITLDLGCDLAPIEVVKSGQSAPTLPAKTGQPGQLSWGTAGTSVTVTGEQASAETGETTTGGRTDSPRLSWRIELAPGQRQVLRWQLLVEDPWAVVVPPAQEPPWSRPQVHADDPRLVRLLNRSLDDLRALLLADSTAPDEVFLGAGVPWFLTLFGRDSIWAARMLLPLGTELAGSTLRVLAGRQGRHLDQRSGEAPGKILHELRRHEFTVTGNGLRLPASYYGSVDATLLWAILLHEAWRWGLPDTEVIALLPHLEAALGWLAEHADADGDGFVEYIDRSGQGLANQGWKDSHDAIRFRDGRLAAPPIALAEVQGYAYQAAVGGADLLDAFGRPGAQRWRDYAGLLAERFRAAFWVDGPHGPQPALALDRDKRPVDSLTSNIGHLLGTGLLSPQESAVVAELLGTAELSGGFGLRTMSAKDVGFSPLSYHCGSIWPHDTAIVLHGLARDGFHEPAARLAAGLLAAAEAFDYRLPELFSGDDRTALGRPVPYPAACRPQAWSAAAAVTLLSAAAGVYPDVPAGRVHLRPLSPLPFGALTVRQLRVAQTPFGVTIDHSGAASISGLPAGLAVSD
ncbi:MAG TPA: glycogen debranching N-terminal domain-containing protein [Micromonosporaceae bacterium]|nr:glycogen debranching N-terminal domain-containing protein [Micromonosporaceae bacterium]